MIYAYDPSQVILLPIKLLNELAQQVINLSCGYASDYFNNTHIVLNLPWFNKIRVLRYQYPPFFARPRHNIFIWQSAQTIIMGNMPYIKTAPSVDAGQFFPWWHYLIQEERNSVFSSLDQFFYSQILSQHRSAVLKAAGTFLARVFPYRVHFSTDQARRTRGFESLQ